MFYSVVGVLRGQRFERIHFQELRITLVFVSSDVVWFIHIHSQRPCGGGFHCPAKVGGLCRSACEYSELHSGPELGLGITGGDRSEVSSFIRGKRILGLALLFSIKHYKPISVCHCVFIGIFHIYSCKPCFSCS